MDLNGTAVVVTGASRGLGAALARRLAAQGAKVVGVARGKEDLQAVIAEIRAAGGEAHALVADVGDKEQTYAIAGAAAALVGPVRLLIHNASSLGPLPMPELLDTACEDLAAVLETNLIGPFRLTKALVGAMALHGEGLVLSISSDAAVNGYPGWGAYGVSKAALDHLMRTWAAELADDGVRFLDVDPGEMDTQMHADAMPDADRSGLTAPDEVARRIVAWIQAETRTGIRVEASSLELPS